MCVTPRFSCISVSQWVTLPLPGPPGGLEQKNWVKIIIELFVILADSDQVKEQLE